MTRRARPARLIAAAFWLGCGMATPTSPEPEIPAPPIYRFLLYARNWPIEEVELALVRDTGGSTVTLFRPARDGRPRVVLDSVGPNPADTEEVRVMLDSFDVWALNEPNAPGAACRTVDGQRSCAITANDYSVVMQVERGWEVRVQRYTGLEQGTASAAVRGLGDYVLAWARRREAGAQ